MLNIEYFLQKSGPASVAVRNEGGCKGRRPAETVCKRKETARKKFFPPAFFFYVGCFFSFRPGAWERNFGEPLPDREYHCPGAEQQVPRLC